MVKKSLVILIVLFLACNICAMNEHMPLTQHVELMRATHFKDFDKSNIRYILHYPIMPKEKDGMCVSAAMSKLTKQDYALLDTRQKSFINKSWVWNVVQLPQEIQQKIFVFMAQKWMQQDMKSRFFRNVSEYRKKYNKKSKKLASVLTRLPVLMVLENAEYITLSVYYSHSFSLDFFRLPTWQQDFDAAFCGMSTIVGAGVGVLGGIEGCQSFILTNGLYAGLSLFGIPIGGMIVGCSGYIGFLCCRTKLKQKQLLEG